MSAYRTQSIVAYTGEAGGVAAALCAQGSLQPAELDPALLVQRLQKAPHNVEIFGE